MLAACALAIKDKDNAAELLVEGFTDEETEIITSIRESRIFDKVYYINQSDAWTEINKLNQDSSAMEILDAGKSAVRFWSTHFKYFEHISKRYSDISIWDDHFTFGVALAYLKIPYHYYEESPGCNYRRDIFIQLSEDKITNKAFAPITKQFGLRGNYPYAVSVNYDFSLNPMEKGEKDRDFSLVKELQCIKETSLDCFETIRRAFAPNGYFLNYYEEKYNKKRKNFLLIGQHYSDYTYKNTSTIKYVLSLLTDYFGEHMNLWIKNHPSNYFNPMQLWFPQANFIVDKVPIELMVADDVLHFDRVASISSSAPLAMKSQDTDVILFQNIDDGDSFEAQKRFLDLNRYYITVKLIEKIKDDYGMEALYTCEVEELSLQYLIKYQSINIPAAQMLQDINEIHALEQQSNGIRCFFIDRMKNPFTDEETLRHEVVSWLLSCSENDVVFFVNSDKKNLFFDFDNHEVMEFVYPLPFDLIDSHGSSGLFGYGNPEYPLKNTIGKLHQETYSSCGNTERQIIYMYTKNADIPKKILSYSIEKMLTNCGIELKYEPSSINYRELVFESMLDQLEQQYVSLQEKNNQLREQISEIKDNQSNRDTTADVNTQVLLESVNEATNMLMNKMTDIMENKNDSTQIITESINANATMLMSRMTDLDEHLIKFLTWYGFKKRVKEKIRCIFGTKREDNK